MHEKVKAFLDTKKAAERKKYEEKKAGTLIELGLFEKEYAKSVEESIRGEFPYSEYDEESGIVRWYQKVAIDVTDEEYEEIIKYSKPESPETNNPIAKVLTAIAWSVFICGFIVGIIIAVKEDYFGDPIFAFDVALTYWGVSFISGMMFLGFAEIIKLLDAIRKK